MTRQVEDTTIWLVNRGMNGGSTMAAQYINPQVCTAAGVRFSKSVQVDRQQLTLLITFHMILEL